MRKVPVLGKLCCFVWANCRGSKQYMGMMWSASCAAWCRVSLSRMRRSFLNQTRIVLGMDGAFVKKRLR